MKDKKNKTELNSFKINLRQVQIPKPVEVPSLDYVKWGVKNDWPDKLIDLLNTSPMHNAIVSSKVDYAQGDGFIYEDVKIDNIIDNFNDEDSLSDFFVKILWDLFLYGGYAIEMLRTRGGGYVAQHIDFAKLRSGKKNEMGKIDHWYYSTDWSQYRKTNYKPIEIPVWTENTKEEQSIIVYKQYRPGQDYYPLPQYVAAIAAIETDAEIQNFHLANIKNGFNPGAIISFFEIPEEEERQKLKRLLLDMYTGTDAAGSVIVLFGDDPTKTPKVESAQISDLDKKFLQLKESVISSVLSGHKVTSPMLVGIKTEGQLGGSSEMENAFKIFKSQIINPITNIALKGLNKVLKAKGYGDVDIAESNPVSFQFSENILSQILTQNEMRDLVGYDELEGSDKIKETEIE